MVGKQISCAAGSVQIQLLVDIVDDTHKRAKKTVLHLMDCGHRRNCRAISKPAGAAHQTACDSRLKKNPTQALETVWGFMIVACFCWRSKRGGVLYMEGKHRGQSEGCNDDQHDVFSLVWPLAGYQTAKVYWTCSTKVLAAITKS